MNGIVTSQRTINIKILKPNLTLGKFKQLRKEAQLTINMHKEKVIVSVKKQLLQRKIRQSMNLDMH